MSGGWVRWMWCGALALLLAGCCCPPSPAEARRTPNEAIQHFQHVLRHGCGDAAYEALSERSKEHVPEGKFTWAIDLNIGEYGERFRPEREELDFGVWDALAEARLVGILEGEPRPGQAYAVLEVVPPPDWVPPEQLAEIPFEQVILVFEGMRWQVGLVETGLWLQQ